MDPTIAVSGGLGFVCAHEVVEAPGASPGRCAFVLHGILGSRGNWRGFARAMARAYPGWRWVLVDLRGHGESHGAAGPHTVAACAADLDRLAVALGVRPAAVVGHSFGGKVALAYARDHGRGLEAVWSLDSPPGKSDAGAAGGEVARVIEAIRAAPMPVSSRQVVVRHFEAAGFGEGIARWMTTNLRRGAAGFEWVFDLAVVDALLADYRGVDLWPFLDAPPLSLAVHLLVATRGGRWSSGELARVDGLADVGVHRLDAGHWVHVDDPGGVRAALAVTFEAG